MSEVALAVMLVTAAGLTVKSLQQLSRQDLGLVTRNVLTFAVTMPSTRQLPNVAETARAAQFFQTFEERLRRCPGCRVGGRDQHAADRANGNQWTGLSPRSPVEARGSADRRVPRCLTLVLRDGRDHASSPVVGPRRATPPTPARSSSSTRRSRACCGQGNHRLPLLGNSWAPGSTMARRFERLSGIVRDVRSRRVDAPPDAETYVPRRAVPAADDDLHGANGDRRHSRSSRSCAARSPIWIRRLPLAALRTFEEVLEGATRASRLYSALTALFGVLAAALAIVGIYSVMSYTVAQRTRELAIRSALGASNQGLLALVLREGFLMTRDRHRGWPGRRRRRVAPAAGASLSSEPYRSARVGWHGCGSGSGGAARLLDPGAARVPRAAGGCVARRVALLSTPQTAKSVATKARKHEGTKIRKNRFLWFSWQVVV